FFPALRPEAISRIVEAPQHLQRERINGALRLATGREGTEAAGAILGKNTLGQDRASRIPGAEKKHVVDAVSHGRPPRRQSFVVGSMEKARRSAARRSPADRRSNP